MKLFKYLSLAAGPEVTFKLSNSYQSVSGSEVFVISSLSILFRSA